MIKLSVLVLPGAGSAAPGDPREDGARGPLRDAAARGRLAAGDRRGRRRGALRAQVPRRRPGPAGPGRRARRRRDRRAPSACRSRRSCSRCVDADLARTEPDPEIQDLIRASAGPPTAAAASTSRSTTCPARAAFDPLAWQPDAALASRIVWFDALVDQPRPHRAQHQHAGLAWPALADRPRRRALLPSLLDRLRGARDEPVRGDQGPCAAAVRERDRRGRRRSGRAPLAPSASPRSSRSFPTTGSATTRRSPSHRAHRAAYVDYFARRLESPRAFAEEAAHARSMHV